MKRHALEALVGSLGIAAVGWLSIPLVGRVAGVHITAPQALRMSALFFLARFAWLWLVRGLFAKAEKP